MPWGNSKLERVSIEGGPTTFLLETFWIRRLQSLLQKAKGCKGKGRKSGVSTSWWSASKSQISSKANCINKRWLTYMLQYFALLMPYGTDTGTRPATTYVPQWIEVRLTTCFPRRPHQNSWFETKVGSVPELLQKHQEDRLFTMISFSA